MIKGSGYVLIGHARGAGGVYQFTDALNALWCVYIDAYTGHGIIKKSTNQGLSWFQTDDVGLVDEISIRGGYAAYRRAGKVTIYDLDEGFQLFQRVYGFGPLANQLPSGIIPVPELGGFAMYVPGTYGGSYAVFNIITGTQQQGLGDLVVLWGTQNNNIKFPDPVNDKIFYVARYTDPFSPDISYDFLVDSQTGPVFKPPPGQNYVIPLPMGDAFHSTQYEGFLSGRNSLRGVGVESRDSAANFYLPADPWQTGVNTAPLYVPTLAAPDLRNYSFPVQSTPSGVSYDQPYAKGGAYGICGGYPTFGLFEPGGGLALCRLFGANTQQSSFGGRKFLGNFKYRFSRTRIWMPYTNGIFGMGLSGVYSAPTQYGGSPAGSQSLFWVYDKFPDDIPARVVSKNGKFVEDDRTKLPMSAKTNDRSYVRW